MELLVEVAPVSGDLVEDQRQPERQLLVLEAGVGGEDGLAAQGAAACSTTARSARNCW